MTERAAILGVILAGGQSRRMGSDKALIALRGRPLIAHVAGRLAPQVGLLTINANDLRFDFLGFQTLVDDPRDRDGGPLAGIKAALAFAAANHCALVATAPCDAPFLPIDLVARLRDALGESQSVAMAQSRQGLEPMFGLWSVAMLATVSTALDAGRSSPGQIFSAVGGAPVQFAANMPVDPFANINAAPDLARAEAVLALESERAPP